MTFTTKQGRPKLSEIVKLERKVAGQYIKLVELRQQLNLSVAKIHPSLSVTQQKALIQPILTVAEEYRFWSQLDNDLLAIQRHACAQTRYNQLSSTLQTLLDQLITSYELVFTLREELEQAKSVKQPEQISQWTDSLSTLKSQSVIYQSHMLYQLAKQLRTQLCDAFQVDQVKSIRTVIRAVLVLIKHHRLSLVYQTNSVNAAGRPVIPLPIQVVRAEEDLIALFNQLTALYKYHQLKIPTPAALADKYQQKKASSLGRPKLTERQKLDKAITKKQKQIADLLDNHVQAGENDERRPLRRGRKPHTFEQKYQKLLNELSALKLQIK